VLKIVKKKKRNTNKQLAGFIDFVREQGVVGLAVGFILGGSVKEVVSSLVNDIINPLLGLVLRSTENLANTVLNIGTAEIRYGHFINVVIDFLVIAIVVYYGVKGLGLDNLDKK
jgi:large conductance mechanosensitive channel